jgi:hypothetical protein
MRALDLTAVTGAALIALAACSTADKTLGGGGATSGAGGGQGGLGASTTSSGQGGMSASTSASSGQGGMSASTTASSGQGGAGTSTAGGGKGGMSAGGAGGVGGAGAGGGQGGLGGGDAGPSVCMNGETCTVDLRLCPPSEEAASWQGRSSLQGTLELASYTTHFGWVCQVSTGGILQAWPVLPVPGWWCGTVIPACVCSPADNCK